MFSLIPSIVLSSASPSFLWEIGNQSYCSCSELYLKEVFFKLCYTLMLFDLDVSKYKDISFWPINPDNKDALETPWSLILGGFWCAKIKTATTHSKEPHLKAQPRFRLHTCFAYMFCLVFKCLPVDVGLVAWHVPASDQGAGGPGCGWEEEGEERRWDEQPSSQRKGIQSLMESCHDALDYHLVTPLSPVSKPISCLKSEGRWPAKKPQPYFPRG